jgi:DNA-directed RNA polymerase specialized sigma24 family protein
MSKSAQPSPTPFERLAGDRDRHIGYLRARFPTLSADDCADLVQDAFADPDVWAKCPADATDAHLSAWFRRVIHYDAIDHIREVVGRDPDRGSSDLLPAKRRVVSLTELVDSSEPAPALASPDPALEAVEREDERRHVARIVGVALEDADPETARLLRARLAEEAPAAIAQREGWTRTIYERRLTAAKRQLAALIAHIEADTHCAEVRALLRAHVGELLTSSARQAVDDHLLNCIACKAFKVTVTQRVRRKIAALFPWPAPAVLTRIIGRDPITSDLASAGGGAAAVGLLGGGAKLALIACSGVIAAGGCIGLIATRDHDRRPEPAQRTTGSTTSAGTATLSPRTGQSKAHGASTSVTTASQHAAARDAARARAARRRAASREPSGEGEFGPQTAAPSNPTPAAPTEQPSAPPVAAPARSSPPAQLSAPKQSAAPGSTFQNEFTP